MQNLKNRTTNVLVVGNKTTFIDILTYKKWVFYNINKNNLTKKQPSHRYKYTI